LNVQSRAKKLWINDGNRGADEKVVSYLSRETSGAQKPKGGASLFCTQTKN